MAFETTRKSSPILPQLGKCRALSGLGIAKYKSKPSLQETVTGRIRRLRRYLRGFLLSWELLKLVGVFSLPSIAPLQQAEGCLQNLGKSRTGKKDPRVGLPDGGGKNCCHEIGVAHITGLV